MMEMIRMIIVFIGLMIIIEIAFAFVLAVTMGSPLAFRLASRKFDPRRNHPMIF